MSMVCVFTVGACDTPMCTVDGTLGCVCLECSTVDEVEHSLRQSTGISEQRGIIVEECFRMERLETL